MADVLFIAYCFILFAGIGRIRITIQHTWETLSLEK